MNKSYYINHWVLTLATGPLILTLFNYSLTSIQGLAIELRDTYLVMLVFSMLFSIPTLATYYFIFRTLDKKKINLVFSKFILIAWTIAGLTTTMLLIGGSASTQIIFAYSISAIIAGVLLRINNLTKDNFDATS